MLFTVWDAVRNGNIFARGLRNSVAHSYYLSDQNADKQTEIDSQGISNEHFLLLGMQELMVNADKHGYYCYCSKP